MKQFQIPKDIEREASKYIKEVISLLEEKELLANVDNAALMMLARNLDMFIKASKQINRDGLMIAVKDVLIAHPLIKVARDAQVQAVKIMTEFGLTAKARTKLEKIIPQKEEDSPFDRFIKDLKETR